MKYKVEAHQKEVCLDVYRGSKGWLKAAGRVETQHTLTTSANISEGQTREIVGCEHKGQNAYGLILGGDTEAGRDIKVWI